MDPAEDQAVGMSREGRVHGARFRSFHSTVSGLGHAGIDRDGEIDPPRALFPMEDPYLLAPLQGSTLLGCEVRPDVPRPGWALSAALRIAHRSRARGRAMGEDQRVAESGHEGAPLRPGGDSEEVQRLGRRDAGSRHRHRKFREVGSTAISATTARAIWATSWPSVPFPSRLTVATRRVLAKGWPLPRWRAGSARRRAPAASGDWAQQPPGGLGMRALRLHDQHPIHDTEPAFLLARQLRRRSGRSISPRATSAR